MEKKSLFKRVTALLCCIVMLVTTVPIYAAPSKTPVTVGLNVLEGVNYYIDEEQKLDEIDNAGDNYYCKAVENGTITLAGWDWDAKDEVSLAGQTIVFYASVSDGKSIQFNSSTKAKISVDPYDITATDGNKLQYRITVQITASSGAVSLTAALINQQVTVTFSSADTNCVFKVVEGNQDKTVSGTYPVDQGSSLSFKVTQKFADPSTQYAVYVDGVKREAVSGVYTIERVDSDTEVYVRAEAAKLTVTGPTGEGFTYNRQQTSNVNYGASFNFTVKPAAGYENPSVSIEGTADLIDNGDGAYVLENITSDIRIVVTPAGRIKYTVDLYSGTDYKAEWFGDNKSGEFAYGDTATFTVTANTGFAIASVRANNTRLTADTDGIYSFTVTGNTDVTVEVSKARYDITYNYTASTAFTVGKGIDNAEYGTTYTFTVTPGEGYKAPVVKTKVNDVETILRSTTGTYTFTVLGKTEIIIEDPAVTTYTVILPHGAEYTAEFVEDYSETVEHGKSVSFTIKMNNGYEGYDIASVTANNKPLTAENGVYTVSNVTADVTVAITTKKANCTVTYKTVGDVNAFTVNKGLDNAEYGSSYTFTVTPVEGYKAPVVKVDGDPVSPNGNQYTITISNRETVIEITAGEQITYSVTLVGATGSNLTVDNPSPKHGDTVTVTIAVEEQYSADNLAVSVNGIAVPVTNNSDGTYTVTITNITEDKTVSVSALQKKTYEVTLPAAPVGYTLEARSSTTVSAGDDFVFTLTVSEGFTGDAVVKANGTEVEKDSSGYYRVTVNSNTTITVEGITAITFSATVDIDDENAAKVEAVSAEAIPYGGSYKFKVEVNPGYRLNYVYAGGEVTPDVSGVYTIDNVTDNIEINVSTVKNVLTVNYVSEEEYHTHNTTKTYFIDDTINLNDVVPEGKCAVHVFDGWYVGSSLATEDYLKNLIKTGDNEVTLTAKFDLAPKAVEWLLNMNTSTKASGSNPSTVTFRTYVNVREGIDPCVDKFTDVVALGTLLARDNTSLADANADSLKDALTQRDFTNAGKDYVSAEKLKGYEGTVYNYYYNVDDMKLSDVIGNYYELKINTKTPDSLYAAGWMECSVGGVKIYVLGKQSGLADGE